MILPEIRGAKEVAVLVKCLPNLDDCAALIEQYAQLVASGARLDATLERFNIPMDESGQSCGFAVTP